MGGRTGVERGLVARMSEAKSGAVPSAIGDPGYRSDVLRQVFARGVSPSVRFFAGAMASDDHAKVEAKPEDVGDQALMRGSRPQFRDFVRGCPLSSHGRRSA